MSGDRVLVRSCVSDGVGIADGVAIGVAEGVGTRVGVAPRVCEGVFGTEEEAVRAVEIVGVGGKRCVNVPVSVGC